MKLPTKSERVIIYGDIHVDTHDEASITLLKKIARVFKPTIAINHGDLVNMDAVSSYLVDMDKTAKIQDELDIAFEVQKDIIKAMGPKARNIFIRGNHERRLHNAILSKLPGIAHLRILQLPEILRLDELGMEYEEYSVRLGSVEIFHGWNANKWSGVSPRMALEKIGFTHSLIQGHSHRQSLISKAIYPGGQVFGCESGSLCDQKKMSYLHGQPQDWQRGFAILEYQDGKVAIELIPFFGQIKLTALWRGKLYRS